MQMLTERKANFVNQLRKKTSDIVTKLANKMGENYKITGTSGEKISSALKKIKYPTSYRFSIKHPFDAHDKLIISFEIYINEKLRQSIKSEGVCRWSQHGDLLYPSEIIGSVLPNRRGLADKTNQQKSHSQSENDFSEFLVSNQ